MSDHSHNISRRLYDALEHVGASEDMRKLHQATGINYEITATSACHLQDCDHRVSCFIFGSYCEGTTTPGLNPDKDVLMCNDGYPVIENIRDAAGTSLRMVRDNHTQPGYVKLQLVENGTPQTVYTNTIKDNFDSDLDGRICMKYLTRYGEDNSFSERNGPADTFSIINADFVQACRCKTVPDFASEWIRRPRQYNWPPAHMIDQMKTSGCFVVGVGHPASVEKHIEWRLSFSLQERQLMFNFNPVQHKCYILLKMIKNDLITPQLGKSISSYHCKTCMFNVIEESSACTWSHENLILCVRLCLIKLCSFVKNGVCPNYFIKEENMFDRDIHRNAKPRLIELLTQMILDGPTLLMHIRCDQIGDILKRRSINNSISYNTKTTHIKNLKAWTTSQQDILRSNCISLLKKGEVSYNYHWLSKYIRQYFTHFKDHDEQQIREASHHILPFLHSRLAQQYVSLAFSERFLGQPSGSVLLCASYYHFREGSTCDVTSSRLVHASVMYKLGQNDRCLSLLDQINADLQPDVETTCYCDLKSKKIYTSSSPSSTAACVMFLQSEKAIVPAPLQYEMFRSADTPPVSRDEKKDYWYDCAVLDGTVYVPFLQYLVYSKLNNIKHKRLSISKLRSVIENDRNLGHRETGYNLLGWIYVQENRIVEGVRCFCESWKIRPHHNAAKWHLGVTVHNH